MEQRCRRELKRKLKTQYETLPEGYKTKVVVSIGYLGCWITKEKLEDAWQEPLKDISLTTIDKRRGE